jgi:hypothetical protein
MKSYKIGFISVLKTKLSCKNKTGHDIITIQIKSEQFWLLKNQTCRKKFFSVYF